MELKHQIDLRDERDDMIHRLTQQIDAFYTKRPADAITHSDESVRRLDYEPRELQWKWRQNPPPYPPDPRHKVDGEDWLTYQNDPSVKAAQDAQQRWYFECT